MNHVHVFVYIGRPEPLNDAEIIRRISLTKDGKRRIEWVAPL